MSGTLTTLGAICDIEAGNAWKSGSFSDVPVGLPVVRIQNLGDNANEKTVYWPNEYSERYLVRSGDLLVSLSGSFKAVRWNGPPSLLNQRIVKLSPKIAVDQEWLRLFMVTSLGSLARLGRHALISNVSLTDLRQLPVHVPPLPDQLRVVDLLSRAENIVRMRREAEQKVKEIKQALFLDMFGGESSNPVVKVDDCLASKKGGVRTGPFGSQLLHSEFTNEGIAVLGIDNAVNNRFEWSVRRFISPEKYKQLFRYTVHPGDVLITIMGTCGRCAIVPEGIPVTINTKHLCALTLASDRCLPEYLQGAFLFDPAVRRQLAAATKGAIMAGLNMQIIRNLMVRLPSIDRQAVYRAAALQYDEMRRVVETALHTAEKAFQSFLAEVFDA